MFAIRITHLLHRNDNFGCLYHLYPVIIVFGIIFRGDASKENMNLNVKEGKENEFTILITDGLFFIANAVAALSLSPYDLTGIGKAIPLLLTAGVLVNLFSARLAYSSGSLARTFNALVSAGIWMTWSLNGIRGML